jgi:hypothetical protein
VRDRLRFRSPPSVAHDALFVVAGGAHGAARLYRIDPYSGDVRWTRMLGAGETPAAATASTPLTIEGSPLVGSDAVAVAIRAVRSPGHGHAAHAGGVTLAAFAREDGAPLAPAASSGARGPAVAPSGTSWLAVDDAFIGNAPTGELVSVDAHGALRWRHILAERPLEADVPRRLEPILRSGALFVPHAGGSVLVLGPKSGELLGSIDAAQAGAIPDLLRVDERGDFYIAEESGHLVAFGALPRLRLV